MNITGCPICGEGPSECTCDIMWHVNIYGYDDMEDNLL